MDKEMQNAIKKSCERSQQAQSVAVNKMPDGELIITGDKDFVPVVERSLNMHDQLIDSVLELLSCCELNTEELEDDTTITIHRVLDILDKARGES